MKGKKIKFLPGEHPIEPYEEAVAEATQPHLQDPGEQN